MNKNSVTHSTIITSSDISWSSVSEAITYIKNIIVNNCSISDIEHFNNRPGRNNEECFLIDDKTLKIVTKFADEETVDIWQKKGSGRGLTAAFRANSLMIDESVNYDLHKLFLIFLEKYKITEYEIINVRCIFDKKNMHYYKIMKSKLNNDFHYFINNTHFNHSVSSIIDDNIWVIKQSQVPGVTVTKILSIIDDTFIIKMMEWYKWIHTQSRRIFPEITNKYFICQGVRDNTKLDLKPNNIIYNTVTAQYTEVDFEFNERIGCWLDKKIYISYLTESIFEFLKIIKKSNLFDYCVEYIDKEII